MSTRQILLLVVSMLLGGTTLAGPFTADISTPTAGQKCLKTGTIGTTGVVTYDGTGKAPMQVAVSAALIKDDVNLSSQGATETLDGENSYDFGYTFTPPPMVGWPVTGAAAIEVIAHVNDEDSVTIEIVAAP